MSLLASAATRIGCGYAVLCVLTHAQPVPSAAQALPAPAEISVDFSHDVQPIFSEHCYQCHGPEKQKNGLRLDSKAEALKGGDSGPAIIPGKSAESRLVQYVAGLDPDTIMPPKGVRLSPPQIALLRAWIDQGANWPDAAQRSAAGLQPSTLNPQPSAKHWFFVPPSRPVLPAVKNQRWIRNSIDHFILSRLEQLGFDPSPEADRRTLIRRLSLDLLGLPPTLEEVEAFLKDRRPDAYERLVDRLLASQHFGERWGRHWLDLARYADSDGYEKDSVRPYAYLYRDWVINAINRDLPLDEFAIEQLAGDLLPEATQDQKIATGLHRNTLTNKEGGVDQEEFRCKATVDRVNTTGAVWLGLTIGCAECHSHKYDPISQKEFYQLYAFFNNASEKDIPAPQPVELAAYKAEKARWEMEGSQMKEAQHLYLKNEVPAKQADWERTVQLPAIRWTVLEPTMVSATDGATLKILPDQSIQASGKSPAKDTYTVVIDRALPSITGFRLEILEDFGPGKGSGRSKGSTFILSEFTVKVESVQAALHEPGSAGVPHAGSASVPLGVGPGGGRPPEPAAGDGLATGSEVPMTGQRAKEASQEPPRAATDEAVVLQNASATGGSKNGPVEAAIDGNRKTGWTIDPQPGHYHVAVFETIEDLSLRPDCKLVFQIDQQSGSEQALPRFRISTTSAPRPLQADRMPDDVIHILETAYGQRTEDQKSALAKYFREEVDPIGRKGHQQLADHAQKEPKFPETKAQTIAENETPRRTFIHVRGDFLRPGEEVQPATLSIMPPLKGRGPKADRLDLARWLFDPANPLTGRVAANRLWFHLFGRGIVTTLNDFGTRGEKPSHPELLDWLATEWPRLGWSRKAMIKLIVSSATYRQSSHYRPDLRERDPNNELLARQNRFRLEAENIRDLYLAASGLLHPAIGGPSIRPPLPADIAAIGYANSIKWKQSEGEEKYRRGLYIFFQRTVPYPMLTTFDAPDSNVTCTRRERSNTPLQALTLLNDPVFFECAQHLGRRLDAESDGNPPEKLRRAFAQCLGRQPAGEELSRLARFYADQMQLMQRDPETARKIAGAPAAKSSSAAEIATLVAVARTLLNLDEFVTRE